jgi:RHS repeat-associated protein
MHALIQESEAVKESLKTNDKNVKCGVMTPIAPPVQERTSGNTPQITYTRGPDLSGTFQGAGGIGGMLARSTGYSAATGAWSTHNNYHADANGNITYLATAAQALGASYRYDPFGRTITSSGTLVNANTYRFSSKELHLLTASSSSVYSYGYRFYDPNTGRWLNRDPIFERGGINLYGFVRNRPVNGVDSDGRALWGPPFMPPGPPPEGPFECGNRIKNEVWKQFGENRGDDDPSARKAHCIAHCRIAKECPGGAGTSWIGGLGKEFLDELKQYIGIGDGYDSGDMTANAHGRKCAKGPKSCEEACDDALKDGSLYPPPPPLNDDIPYGVF